jgi:hypothetical protein
VVAEEAVPRDDRYNSATVSSDSSRSFPGALASGFRRLRRVLLAAAVLILLYAAAGFWLLPWLARPRIEHAASESLARPVTLQRLRFNPFALSGIAEGLDIRDLDGAPLLHWERLTIDFAAWKSLFRREWWFGEISLEGAAGRLALLPGGALNIDDIVARLAPPAADAAAPAGPPPVLGIGRLRIADSSLAFVDRSTDATFTTTLGPLRIDLRDFTTRRGENNAYTFRGSTESGETFSWSGRFGLDPLRSDGEFSLDKVNLTKYRPYYRGVVPFDIKSGTADLHSGYRVVWGASGRALGLTGASVAIHDVALSEHGKEEIAAATPILEAEGGDIDVLRGTVAIAKLSTRGGHVLMRKTQDGHVNLLDMVLPFFETPGGSPAAAPPSQAVTSPAAASATGSPATVRIGEMEFADYTLDAEDLSPPRPVRVRLDQIGLHLKGVDNVAGTTSKGTLSLRWKGGGTVRAEGDVSLVGLEGDLHVNLDGLDVTPVEPYVQPALDLRVTRGTFSAEGRFQANLYDAARTKIDFTGDVRMSDFASVDGRDGGDFLSWKSVRMRAVDYSLDRDRMRIADLAIDGARGVLGIAPDGVINLATVLRLAAPPAESADDAASPAAAASPDGAAAPAPPAPPARPDEGDTRIARARMKDCRLEMIDRTTEPPAALALNRLEGTLVGLSSKPGARAEVHIKGVAGDTAPVALDGLVDPLGADTFSDLVLTAHAVDLAPLAPYAARYLGYALDRGRLDVDMRYQLADRRVKSENMIAGDPFTLGEKVESPGATHMPVKLGLALLRDRHGVVKLDVPVEGSLDDPKFRLGRVILRAVINIFAKLVTSPFTLLAHAFAGRDDIDLSVIDFAPGSAALEASAQPRLDALVKGLTERPGLSLVITGRADPGGSVANQGTVADAAVAGGNGDAAPPGAVSSPDIDALRRARLDAMVRQAKWQSLRRSVREATPVETVKVEPDEAAKHLKTVWKEWIEKHPEAANPKPETPEEMEARLLPRMEVGAADLAVLAEARARAVHDHLAAAGIEAARLSVKSEPQGGLHVTLELQ